jgi:hypothetical protein
MAKQALVGGYSHPRLVYLTRSCLAANLPGQLTHLRQCLRWDRFSKAGETAGNIDWQSAA